MVSTYGSYISSVGVLIFLFALVKAFSTGPKAADNPWGEGADTLEWTLPSPPDFHSYDELPEIKDEGAH